MGKWRRQGELIRHYRDLFNYSQTELADLIGLRDGQYISNVERNMCGLAGKHRRKMLDTLNIPKEEFYLAILEDTLDELRYDVEHAYSKHPVTGTPINTESLEFLQ